MVDESLVETLRKLVTRQEAHDDAEYEVIICNYDCRCKYCTPFASGIAAGPGWAMSKNVISLTGPLLRCHFVIEWECLPSPTLE